MSPTDAKLILDALAKVFDDFDARWERRFSETRATHETSSVVPVPSQAAAVGATVVADNWGGLFDEDGDSIVAYSDAPVVADNWGGLFDCDDTAIAADLSAHLPGDQAKRCPTIVQASSLAPHPMENGSEVFGFDTVRPHVPNSVTPAPATPSPLPVTPDLLSVPPQEKQEYQRQIQELEKLEDTDDNHLFLCDDHARTASRLVVLPFSMLPVTTQPSNNILAEFTDKSRVRTALPDFLAAVVAGVDPPRAELMVDNGAIFVNTTFQDGAPFLGCVVTMASGVDHIGVLLSGVAADPYICVGFWLAQGKSSKASDPLQLVVSEDKHKVPSTLPILPSRCSLNGLILIQRCFWLPTCCRWDAVLCCQHRSWPPPIELRFVSCNVGLRPLPWPSFNMVGNSVTCCPGQLCKPPWCLIQVSNSKSSPSLLHILSVAPASTLPSPTAALVTMAPFPASTTDSTTGVNLSSVIIDNQASLDVEWVLNEVSHKQLWPPPVPCVIQASAQFEIQSNGVQLRPTPWPSFIDNIVQVGDIIRCPCCNSESIVAGLLFHWHLITASRVMIMLVNRDCTWFMVHWPLPACVCGLIRKGRLGNHLISFQEVLIWAWGHWISFLLAQVDLSRLVPWDPGGSQLLLSGSMVGCVLIHELVQRKCGDKCRCFLLEVAGQQSRIAEGKAKDHCQAEQDLLQQLSSSPSCTELLKILLCYFELLSSDVGGALDQSVSLKVFIGMQSLVLLDSGKFETKSPSIQLNTSVGLWTDILELLQLHLRLCDRLMKQFVFAFLMVQTSSWQCIRMGNKFCINFLTHFSPTLQAVIMRNPMFFEVIAVFLFSVAVSQLQNSQGNIVHNDTKVMFRLEELLVMTVVELHKVFLRSKGHLVVSSMRNFDWFLRSIKSFPWDPGGSMLQLSLSAWGQAESKEEGNVRYMSMDGLPSGVRLSAIGDRLPEPTQVLQMYLGYEQARDHQAPVCVLGPSPCNSLYSVLVKWRGGEDILYELFIFFYKRRTQSNPRRVQPNRWIAVSDIRC